MEPIFVIPLVLAIFPIPLFFPIMVIGLADIHKENWPIPVIYYSWLLLGMGIVFYMEQKDK